MTDYTNCTLCPRNCNTDRASGQTGYCGMSAELYLARAALHFWEEPCISGKNGSGTVFFAGCNLRCVYCQNYLLAIGKTGKKVDENRLREIYFELKDKGAENINLVTPTHYLPHVIKSIEKAKAEGFDLPFVYNTGSYEKPENLKRLEGLIDVFLPDFKYARKLDGEKYSFAYDYPDKALFSLDEMHRQQPECVFEKGMMKKGMIIRHLLLPGKVIESKLALRRIYERYGDSVYISIMGQYTPLAHVKSYPELNRRVNRAEYLSLCDYALELGIKNAYIQSGESVGESFIPEFDCEGI